MIQTLPALPTQLARWALVGVLAISGCAGGPWLESMSDDDLPIDPPARAYPTAVLDAVNDFPAPQSENQLLPPGEANAPPTIAAPQRRMESPPPAATNLAILPPHLRPPLPQATIPANASPPDQLTTRPVAENLGPLQPASSAADSHLDVSIAHALATPQWPPSAMRIAPYQTTPPPIDVGPASDSSTILPTKEEPTLDRQARVDRARSELIEALEAEVRHRKSENPRDENLPRLEQQLRLIYLAIGRMDDAVSAVESLPQPQQEAYKNMLFGLGIWLSPDEATRPALRSAKVVRSLREATSDLAAVSKLELRNVAFIESVKNYGEYVQFPRNDFRPKQEVILYVEIENFAAEHKSPAGYETELQGSYQIFDSSGQLVAERKLQLDKEICRNYRRDYFLAYKIYMPDNIAPGHYRFELTIEDLKARSKSQGSKLGEGVIEFTIRQ